MRKTYLVLCLALVSFVGIPNAKCGQETSREGKGKSGKAKGGKSKGVKAKGGIASGSSSGGSQISGRIAQGESSSSVAPAVESASINPNASVDTLPLYDRPPEYDIPAYESNNAPSGVNLYDYIEGLIEFKENSAAQLREKCEDLPGWVLTTKTCIGRLKGTNVTMCSRQMVRIIKEDDAQTKLFTSFKVHLPQLGPNPQFAQYTTKTCRVKLWPKRGRRILITEATVAKIGWKFAEEEFDKLEKELLNEIVKHKATISDPLVFDPSSEKAVNKKSA